MTTLERMGIGLILFILVVHNLFGLASLGPFVLQMATLLLILGFGLFIARGKDD